MTARLLPVVLGAFLWASPAVAHPVDPSHQGETETAEAEPDRAILEAQVQALRASLPEASEVPSLWKGIHDHMVAAGLEVQVFYPIDAVPTQFLIEHSFRFELQGRYHTIAQVFDRISRLPHTVVVQGVTMDAPEIVNDQTLITAKGHLVTFQLSDEARSQGPTQTTTPVSDLQKQKRMLTGLLAQKTTTVRMLDELALVCPPSLRLLSLHDDQGKVSMVARAESNEVIAAFAHKLERSPTFEEVYLLTLETMQKPTQRVKEFTLQARLVPTPSEMYWDSPSTVLAAGASYRYTPGEKRDPYIDVLQDLEATAEDVPQTPLQRYGIDKYQLVGVRLDGPTRTALVKDPAGIEHVVRAGIYIGNRWGTVSRIEPDLIEVVEEYVTSSGDVIVRTMTLTLGSDSTE